MIIASNEIKFNELEKKVFKFVCFLGCLIIKLLLESYDRKLMDNRDKKKYRNKGLRGTTVNTVMGEIKYKELCTKFVKKEKEATYEILDKFQLEAITRFDLSRIIDRLLENDEIINGKDYYEKINAIIYELSEEYKKLI